MGFAARCEKLMCVAHDFASCGLLGWSSRAMMPATTWQDSNKVLWVIHSFIHGTTRTRCQYNPWLGVKLKLCTHRQTTLCADYSCSNFNLCIVNLSSPFLSARQPYTFLPYKQLHITAATCHVCVLHAIMEACARQRSRVSRRLGATPAALAPLRRQKSLWTWTSSSRSEGWCVAARPSRVCMQPMCHARSMALRPAASAPTR